MGIYIDMKMPTSCYKCNMRQRDGMDMVCPITHERFSVADANILEYRLENCPLVAIPEHGNLIDRDAFVKELEYSIELDQRVLDGMECVGKDRELLLLDRICRQNSIYYLSEASIIIPASEQEG